ncbi:MAG: hypothetical protein IPL49_18060 [Saprospirales bacterium]|nr:hypothetical protein [Saprospirales bacterium]
MRFSRTLAKQPSIPRAGCGYQPGRAASNPADQSLAIYQHDPTNPHSLEQ